MGIGMKKAVIEYLAQTDVSTSECDFFSIITFLVELIQFGNLDTFYQLCCQHTGGCGLSVYFRDIDSGIIEELA